MDAVIIETITITITLEMEEAQWLKGLMQNPIGHNMEDEPLQDSVMRKKFWDMLDRITIR